MHKVAAIVVIVGLLLVMVLFFRMFLRGAAGHSTRPSPKFVGAAALVWVIVMSALIVTFLT